MKELRNMPKNLLVDMEHAQTLPSYRLLTFGNSLSNLSAIPSSNYHILLVPYINNRHPSHLSGSWLQTEFWRESVPKYVEGIAHIVWYSRRMKEKERRQCYTSSTWYDARHLLVWMYGSLLMPKGPVKLISSNERCRGILKRTKKVFNWKIH